jgi:multiple sugar transport system substrate-binding protein
MRRLLSAATALLVLALAGCGTGWGLSGIGAGGPGVHLTYTLWDPNEQIGYQRSIDEFERLHPNIHVTIEQIPYGNYESKLISEFVSHNGPDLYWVNTPFLAKFIEDEVAMDLTPLIRRDHVDLSQYYPQLVTLHEHDGKIYGLPKDWDTIALYYNKAYFAKHHITIPAQLTWAPDGTGTFTDLLRQATLDTRGRNAASAGFDAKHIASYGVGISNDPQGGYGNYLAMNGASNVLEQPYSTHVTLAEPKATEALQYIVDLMYKQHLAAPASEMGPNGDGSAAQELFARGEIAMYETGDWNTTPISQSVTFPVGVLPLPAGPRGRASVFNGLIDAVNTATPHPREAWELEKWLGSARSQRIMGSGGFVWPAIKSLDPLFLRYWQAKHIDLRPFLDEAQGTVVNFPVGPGIGEALTDIGAALGPAYLGTQPVASAAQHAVRVGDHDLGVRY